MRSLTGCGEKNKRIWFLTALAVPVLQAASGCSWLTALGLGILCLGISLGLESLGVPEVKWLLGIQWVWMIVILSAVLGWSVDCWSMDSLVVPGTLLLLAAWSASSGEEQCMRAGNILRFFIVALLGAVLLSGLWDIKTGNLRPNWRMDNTDLVTVLLLPAAGMGMGGKGAGQKIFLMALTLASSTIVTGVLSGPYAAEQTSAFYELSKSVRLLGTAERFESLAAAGMTLGYYVFAGWSLSLCGRWAEAVTKKKTSWMVWVSAAAAFVGFYIKWQKNNIFIPLGTVIVFVFVPLAAALINKWGKRKKNLEKI